MRRLLRELIAILVYDRLAPQLDRTQLVYLKSALWPWARPYSVLDSTHSKPVAWPPSHGFWGSNHPAITMQATFNRKFEEVALRLTFGACGIILILLALAVSSKLLGVIP
jgi:hypothetical protein